MKMADVKTGIVYWYNAATNWADGSLTHSYDRYPCVRVDNKRYARSSSWQPRSAAIERPNGRMIAIRKVNEDGTPAENAHVEYVVSTAIRCEMTEARQRIDARRAKEKAADAERQVKADEASKVAAELQDRLAALGVVGIKVGWTTGNRWGETSPRVVVSFADLLTDPVANLRALIERLEGGDKARQELAALAGGDAYQRGFSDGEAVNDAQRDAALGYELRPEQAAVAAKFDAEFADRLENGAYER